MNDLSKLMPVKPDQGKAQWVECQVTGIAKDEAKRTHLVGIPPLMPCTTIFVHGVNSDGEWYDGAAGQFASGLKQRLGRTDLQKLEPDPNNFKRFLREVNGKRTLSPILPFYWGYKVPPKQRIKLVDSARSKDRPDAWADRFGKLRWHLRVWTTRSLTLAGATLLTACSLGGLGGPYPGVPALSDPGRAQPYTGEVAAPQVAYRIDENRYFEIVPYGRGACTNAMVHFVDKAKGIRSEVVLLDRGPMLRATLIIDASNDQYLVAPVTRGNTDCSSGGGLCGGSKLPYSTDGGKTWKRANPRFSGDDIYLSGDDVYVSANGRSGQTAKLSAAPQDTESWSRFNLTTTPPMAPTKQPLDIKFHCTPNGKE